MVDTTDWLVSARTLSAVQCHRASDLSNPGNQATGSYPKNSTVTVAPAAGWPVRDSVPP
jgi:hypothetical protein